MAVRIPKRPHVHTTLDASANCGRACRLSMVVGQAQTRPLPSLQLRPDRPPSGQHMPRMRSQRMSNDKRHLRPWWRRRRWPLACGVVALTLGAVCVLSFWRSLFGFGYHDRMSIGIDIGEATFGIIVYDEDACRNVEQATAQHRPVGWNFRFLEPRMGVTWLPFERPLLDWRKPLRLVPAESPGSSAIAIGGGFVTPVGGVTRGPIVPQYLGHEYRLSVPLGWPTLLFTGLSAFGFYRLWKHRHPPGHCQRCGFDMKGLAPGSACPECGKASAATSA